MIETGILFGKIHSFYDLNLILSAVDIPPAIPKTAYIDIPGGDGSVDLTEAHGEVKYNDRDCKFTFTMNPAGNLSERAWEEKKTEVSNALNGKVFQIVLDKDDSYYYEGRCEVSEYLSNKRVRQFVVTAKVKPYKMKRDITIIGYNLTADGIEINIKNGRKTAIPEIVVESENATIEIGTTTFVFESGTFKTADIQLKEGYNKMTLYGSGSVTFRFREGEL